MRRHAEMSHKQLTHYNSILLVDKKEIPADPNALWIHMDLKRKDSWGLAWQISHHGQVIHMEGGCIPYDESRKSVVIYTIHRIAQKLSGFQTDLNLAIFTNNMTSTLGLSGSIRNIAGQEIIGFLKQRTGKTYIIGYKHGMRRLTMNMTKRALAEAQ